MNQGHEAEISYRAGEIGTRSKVISWNKIPKLKAENTRQRRRRVVKGHDLEALVTLGQGQTVGVDPLMVFHDDSPITIDYAGFTSVTLLASLNSGTVISQP